jgi:hypothetical protein
VVGTPVFDRLIRIRLLDRSTWYHRTLFLVERGLQGEGTGAAGGGPRGPWCGRQCEAAPPRESGAPGFFPIVPDSTRG